MIQIQILIHVLLIHVLTKYSVSTSPGILLRKVEDRRAKEEQRKHPVGGLDVQSIMEAAFEMRRKALEANDESEEEEGDSDVVWDSEEDCWD